MNINSNVKDLHFLNIANLILISEKKLHSPYTRESLITGWNDEIAVIKKTTLFYFRLMKAGFLFFFFFLFCRRPSTRWPVVYKFEER